MCKYQDIMFSSPPTCKVQSARSCTFAQVLEASSRSLKITKGGPFWIISYLAWYLLREDRKFGIMTYLCKLTTFMFYVMIHIILRWDLFIMVPLCTLPSLTRIHSLSGVYSHDENFYSHYHSKLCFKKFVPCTYIRTCPRAKKNVV